MPLDIQRAETIAMGLTTMLKDKSNGHEKTKSKESKEERRLNVKEGKTKSLDKAMRNDDLELTTMSKVKLAWASASVGATAGGWIGRMVGGRALAKKTMVIGAIGAAVGAWMSPKLGLRLRPDKKVKH